MAMTMSTVLPAVLHGEINSSESGSTLTEVMSNIRHQPYEITALFDICGNKICEHTNYDDTNTIFAIPPYWAPKAILMVHNHTKDITFSGLDLRCVAQFNLQTSLIVSPTRNFYLMRPSKGWPDNSDWVDEFDDITDCLRHHPRHDYDRATARHLALMKIAEHYGFHYKATNPNGDIIASTALCASR